MWKYKKKVFSCHRNFRRIERKIKNQEWRAISLEATNRRFAWWTQLKENNDLRPGKENWKIVRFGKITIINHHRQTRKNTEIGKRNWRYLENQGRRFDQKGRRFRQTNRVI